MFKSLNVATIIAFTYLFTLFNIRERIITYTCYLLRVKKSYSLSLQFNKLKISQELNVKIYIQ